MNDAVASTSHPLDCLHSLVSDPSQVLVGPAWQSQNCTSRIGGRDSTPGRSPRRFGALPRRLVCRRIAFVPSICKNKHVVDVRTTHPLVRSPVFHPVFFLLVEEIGFGRADVDDLRTAVSIFLEHGAFFAVVGVGHAHSTADDALSCVGSVVAFVAHACDGGGSYVRVAEHALAVATFAQLSHRYDPTEWPRTRRSIVVPTHVDVKVSIAFVRRRSRLFRSHPSWSRTLDRDGGTCASPTVPSASHVPIPVCRKHMMRSDASVARHVRRQLWFSKRTPCRKSTFARVGRTCRRGSDVHRSTVLRTRTCVAARVLGTTSLASMPTRFVAPGLCLAMTQVRNVSCPGTHQWLVLVLVATFLGRRKGQLAFFPYFFFLHRAQSSGGNAPAPPRVEGANHTRWMDIRINGKRRKSYSALLPRQRVA